MLGMHWERLGVSRNHALEAWFPVVWVFPLGYSAGLSICSASVGCWVGWDGFWGLLGGGEGAGGWVGEGKGGEKRVEGWLEGCLRDGEGARAARGEKKLKERKKSKQLGKPAALRCLRRRCLGPVFWHFRVRL